MQTTARSANRGYGRFKALTVGRLETHRIPEAEVEKDHLGSSEMHDRCEPQEKNFSQLLKGAHTA